MFKDRIKKLFNKRYGLKRIPSGFSRKRMELLDKYNIGIILDIGANVGQYATYIRNNGYDKEIISFEPLSEACKVLQEVSKKDKNWKIENLALGNMDGKVKINIAGNSFSSSILEMNEAHKIAAPQSQYVDSEEVQMRKLDSILIDLVKTKTPNIFIKIDVQGYEKEVLEGAKKSLSNIFGIELEMSLIELYNGEMIFDKMINYLEAKGFLLMFLEPEFSDPTSGRLLQVNGLFFKKIILRKLKNSPEN